MKKYTLLFLLTNFYLGAYNQVIKGTILDMQTESAISLAAVYFNGTFVGTTSDQNGNFELDVTKNASMPLTISYYAKWSKINFLKEKVFLTGMDFSIHQV